MPKKEKKSLALRIFEAWKNNQLVTIEFKDKRRIIREKAVITEMKIYYNNPMTIGITIQEPTVQNTLNDIPTKTKLPKKRTTAQK